MIEERYNGSCVEIGKGQFGNAVTLSSRILQEQPQAITVAQDSMEAMGEVKPSGDEIQRKETQQRRREEKQRDRDEAARKREEARQAERNADKVILARLFRSGRLGSGQDRKDVVARARQLLSEFSELERREFGPTLERLIAAVDARRVRASKTAPDSIRARYEGELVARFADRYPEPTPEQQAKIEARIQVLVERALTNMQAASESGQAKKVLVERYERELMQRTAQKLGRDLTPATFGPRDAIEMPPLRRFEEQLRVRLAARYPGLSSDQARRLQERIAQATERTTWGNTQTIN